MPILRDLGTTVMSIAIIGISKFTNIEKSTSSSLLTRFKKRAIYYVQLHNDNNVRNVHF